jgi:hypothetical protein
MSIINETQEPVKWLDKATIKELEILMDKATNWMIFTLRLIDHGKTIEYHNSVEEALKEERIGSVWLKVYHPSIKDNPMHEGWKLIQVIDENGNLV